MSHIEYIEVEELAAYLVGLREEWEEGEAGYIEISDKFEDEYGINLDNFHTLLESLFPLLAVRKSELTNSTYVGFAGTEHWIIKKRVK